MEFMEIFKDVAMTILNTVAVAFAGWLGVKLKNHLIKVANDDAKKSVIKIVVQAVEQMYKDLHGKEKLDKAIEMASKELSERGIPVTADEIELLIEAAVGEFNENFKRGTSDTVEIELATEAESETE